MERARVRILMLNGAFGAGKTTLAHALLERSPNLMLFDPEEVGPMLWRVMNVRGDFQDLPQWAPLVVETARILVATTGKGLVVPMTLVDRENYRTIRRGFETIAPTHHFTLLASPETLARRLTERGSDRWAFDQIERCVAALGDPEFAVHLDAELPVETLATTVLTSVVK